MMKKILAAALALLLLCACGSNSKATYTLSDADELLASGAFEGSDMAPLDTPVVSLLYGIDAASITDCAVYIATNTSVSADEIAVLILTDEQAAIAAEQACRARVESQLAVCRSYAPAAVPRLENALICRRGNTVLLAAGDPEIIASLKGLQ